MKDRKKIKILHLRSSGGFYGAEAVILNASRELNQMGCANHICCINNLKNPHAELVDAAFKIGIAASSVDSIALFDWDAVKEIRQMLIDGGFHILHCHDYKASIYGLLASKGMTIRRVITNHGWTHINWKLRLYEAIEGVFYNWFDRIVVVSEAVKWQVRPFILHKSKIEVIENGIDFSAFNRNAHSSSLIAQKNEPSALPDRQAGLPDRQTGMSHEQPNKRSEFGLKENDFVIGIVGRLSPEKGHEYLFRAVALLKKKIEDRKRKIEGIKVLVIGDGRLEGSLKVFCKELGLPVFDIRDFHDQVPSINYSPFSIIFTGVQTDMCSVYQILDLLVMPSLSEGLPMVLLEAMASGVPVVAASVGQIPKIIKDRETGFLVEPREVDGLVDVLGKIIEGGMVNSEQGTGKTVNQFSLQNITKRARKLVQEKYSSLAMAKKYLEVYEWLAE